MQEIMKTVGLLSCKQLIMGKLGCNNRENPVVFLERVLSIETAGKTVWNSNQMLGLIFES